MSERKHTDYVIERKYLAKVSLEEFVRCIVKSHIAGSALKSSSLGDCSLEKEVPT